MDLIALHSWADYGPYEVPIVDWQPQLEAGKEALAERLAGWQERYPEVAVERRLVWGEPAYTLAAASKEAQLMVLGSHGRGGFAGMLLGSVSSTAVQISRVPVIVARMSLAPIPVAALRIQLMRSTAAPAIWPLLKCSNAASARSSGYSPVVTAMWCVAAKSRNSRASVRVLDVTERT